MKKVLLAFVIMLANLMANAQTFTVNNTNSTGQADWVLNGLVLGCPQTTGSGYTGPQFSGTFIEAIQMANLGLVKKIVFAPGVTSVSMSSRWQAQSQLCADGVSIIADHHVQIQGSSSAGNAVVSLLGKNDTIIGVTFNDAFIELRGENAYIARDTFNMTTAWGCIYMYNTKHNLVENNICRSSYSGPSQLSAIRIGSNPPATVTGNTVGDKILNNTIQGFSGNGLQSGEWKQLNPVCDSLLIKGNIFKFNGNAGAYVINSTGSLIDSNYIYGNKGGGLFVEDCKYTNVFRNNVGLDELGNVNGNKGNGVNINGGNNIRVGDPVLGSNTVVASGNSTFALASNNGIAFQLSPTTNLLPVNSSIKSNYIGDLPNGTGSKFTTGTQQCGIYFAELASNTTVLNDTIGGMTSAEGNVVGYSGLIGGSGSSGIQINKNNNTVFIYNNYAGISRTGAAIPNDVDGIATRGAKNIDIWANKVGNNTQGIAFRYDNAGTVQTSFSVMRGNYCGTSNGTDIQPNITCGLSIEWGSNNTTVGGTIAADSNIIANETIGVWVAGVNSNSNLNKILGNSIKNCSSAGIAILNNTKNMSILNNYISGTSAGNGINVSGAPTNIKINDNVISNTLDGNAINFSGTASGISIRGNNISGSKYVGLADPAKGNGIYMTAGNTGIIGGTGANEGNTITDNATDGISLKNVAVNSIQMRRNNISCNAGTGINLNGTANTNYMFNILRIDTSSSNVTTVDGLLKGNTTQDVIIEVFGPSPSCKQSCNTAFGRQGYQYLGTTTTDVNGKWSLTLASPINAADVVQLTATATTPAATNNGASGFVTSEFARCNDILPVEFLSFTVKAQNNGVSLIWKTATETNNDYFIVERSTDGVHFTDISNQINGAGTSFNVHTYSFLDTDPVDGINYYRIKQVDYDGRFDFSNVQVANLNGSSIVAVHPNPNNGQFTIKIVSESADFNAIIYNALGQIIYTNATVIYGGAGEIKVDLGNVAAGVYTLVVKSDVDTWVEKIVKE